MEFTSDDARAHYDAVRDVLDGVVVGLDFDGTLSPVVDDPEAARLHPAAPGALLELAEAVRAVAVITGRPARQAIAMGDLDALGNAMLDRGAELFVFGQYGNERWSVARHRSLPYCPKTKSSAPRSSIASPSASRSPIATAWRAGRPVITATARTTSASSSSAPGAPGCSRAASGSSTTGDSVPSKSSPTTTPSRTSRTAS